MTTDGSFRIRDALRRRWVKPTAIVLVSVVVGWFIVRFVGKISWSAVGDAIRSVSLAELLALIALLLIRQVVNAVPIARFTPGLGMRRSMVSDVSANLAGTIAPPPGDVVVRIAQFRTWDIHPVDGMAGATLNMLMFYGARFAAPALGVAIFSLYAFDTGKLVTGLVSLAIAVVIVAVLVAALQSDTVAESLARRAARAARAMKASVDEQVWVDAVVDFRQRIGKTLNRNLAPALLFMVLGIVVDALILLAAVRFVGIDESVAPWPVVIGTRAARVSVDDSPDVRARRHGCGDRCRNHRGRGRRVRVGRRGRHRRVARHHARRHAGARRSCDGLVARNHALCRFGHTGCRDA